MNHDPREEDMPSSSSHEPIERRAAMEQPGAAAKASRGERSVFPLPFFCMSSQESWSFSTCQAEKRSNL